MHSRTEWHTTISLQTKLWNSLLSLKASSFKYPEKPSQPIVQILYRDALYFRVAKDFTFPSKDISCLIAYCVSNRLCKLHMLSRYYGYKMQQLTLNPWPKNYSFLPFHNPVSAVQVIQWLKSAGGCEYSQYSSDPAPTQCDKWVW